MGLDSVELIMEVEKAFDIRIPDQEAEKIRTVKDFYDIVWNHLSRRHSDKCNSQIIFYRLRKYFTETFQLSKQAFSPDKLLNDLFPQVNRRKEYSVMENRINLQLPKLVLTKSWRILLITVGLISILGGLLFAILFTSFFNYSKWTFLIPVVGISITLLLSELLNPKRIVIQPPLIRDFTDNTLAINYSSIAKDHGTNRKEVKTVINYIIVDKIGVELEEITPEKSFTDDLGVD